jgi:hypothetical protein
LCSSISEISSTRKREQWKSHRHPDHIAQWHIDELVRKISQAANLQNPLRRPVPRLNLLQAIREANSTVSLGSFPTISADGGKRQSAVRFM